MHFYYLSTYRMAELQVFGMEVEAVGRLTVERIAHNGAVHTVGVGRMNTELVGAAGFGVVVDEGSSFVGAFALRMVWPCGVNIPLAPFIRGRQTVIPLVKGVGGCFVSYG